MGEVESLTPIKLRYTGKVIDLVKAFDMRETALKIAAGLGDTGAPKLVQHVVHLVEARQYDRVRVGKPIDVEARVIEEKPAT